MVRAPLIDPFGRRLHYVRLSVTDRCNFRCAYCMPEKHYPEHYTYLKNDEWLTLGEIVRLTKLFTRLGVRKVRLTGGEPLLRPELPRLIGQLRDIPELNDIALTTNGVLLPSLARDLRAAGLARLTVSLDALDPAVFHRVNGGRSQLDDVLQGIDAAAAAGFSPLKINCVPIRGINDTDLLNLVKHFRFSGHILRFIEYMDVGSLNHWRQNDVLPSAEIRRMVDRHYPLEDLQENYFGEVARRYRFMDGGGEIGFIASVSQPFCQSCTRARLSTDGKIFTCLFAHDGTDLRTPLRAGATDNELLAIIRRVWNARMDRYSENRALFRALPEHSEKIEMYKIGG